MKASDGYEVLGVSRDGDELIASDGGPPELYFRGSSVSRAEEVVER